MTALEIINKWCQMAEAKNLPEHKIHFWRIRDMMENKFEVDKTLAILAWMFLIKICKPSSEREILITEVRNYMVLKNYPQEEKKDDN